MQIIEIIFEEMDRLKLKEISSKMSNVRMKRKHIFSNMQGKKFRQKVSWH